MISKLGPIFMGRILRRFNNHYAFCNKADILKTYLQIIPPHKIFELKEKKFRTIQSSLQVLEKGQIQSKKIGQFQSELKTIIKQVKKRTNMIPLPVLTRIAELACRNQNEQSYPQLRKAYTKIVRVAKNGAQKLPLQHLIDLVYRLVKMNKKEYELMKQVQKVIIQDRIKINFPLIRKILFSYTHLNVGSSVLYSHISKTLTIGQHEFRPLELAESAYMLSKVSQNATGGYGIFQLAEKHIEAVLPRMNFTQLTKASSYLLTQNLGSNKFQIKLEQALYNTYPSKDRLKIIDFVALLKSTSGYFFKYKENALLSMLKTSTIRMSKFATLQQFQDIIWSWGRLGKGDKQVWECIQSEVRRHLKFLKPRQIAFFYYSLCSTSHSTQQLLEEIQKKFVQLPLLEINEHYLIKFLLGMQRKKSYDNEIFSMVSGAISKRIATLSNNQFVTFLKILNESQIDYDSRGKIEGVVEALKSVVKKLQSKLYVLKLTEITQLLYLFVKLQIQDQNILQKCFFNLEDVISIPKSAFIKAFFCFTIKQNYVKALQFVPIAQQLTKYGPIGYFFSPYQFPLFSYCIFHLAVNGENLTINQELLRHTQSAVKQINPIILNQFVKKAYDQSLTLIEKYHNKRQ